uniref:Uncharacterized protein n=1 Tax=Leptospirillum ferrodiazotrophum TaxID=412449 RepID=C6HTX3_9BACT|nr:MAG: hypothetical protein UBAL3_44810038 [Leptospirillum ferrodiazotrophum]
MSGSHPFEKETLVEPLTQDLIPLAGTLVGGILTFSGAYLSTALLGKRQRDTESKNLAVCFSGEIAAIVSIIRKRRYLEHIEGLLRMAKDGKRPPAIKIAVRNPYCTVFRDNAGKIGMLPAPLPSSIVRFYLQVYALLEDFENFREGALDQEPLPTVTRLYEEMAALLSDTIRLGETIGKEVERIYPSPSRIH